METIHAMVDVKFWNLWKINFITGGTISCPIFLDLSDLAAVVAGLSALHQSRAQTESSFSDYVILKSDLDNEALNIVNLDVCSDKKRMRTWNTPESDHGMKYCVFNNLNGK